MVARIKTEKVPGAVTVKRRARRSDCGDRRC
jgi:hypothetical protein